MPRSNFRLSAVSSPGSIARAVAALMLLAACQDTRDIAAPTNLRAGARQSDAVASRTCTVTSSADDGDGSLRQMLNDATCATINFSLTYPAVITATSAPFVVRRDISIQGPGAANLAVSGGGIMTALTLGSADASTTITVSIDGLTIQDGRGAAAGILGQGADLTVTNSVIRGNYGDVYAGAIFVDGMLTLDHTTVTDNHATSGAGGVLAAKATVTNSTISGNTS